MASEEKATQKGRMMSITTPMPYDYFLMDKLTAKESLSKLFEFDLEVLHEEEETTTEPTYVDVDKLLGQDAEVTVTQKDGTSRTFHGIISRFAQGGRDERFSHYKMKLVPAAWVLTQCFQSQIFQQKTVPEILDAVFEGMNYEKRLQSTYEPRNYCVQYRETDFAFVSRIMEEEGIYYYFEHSGGTHKIIFGDSPQGHSDCPTKSTLPVYMDMNDKRDWVSSVKTWTVNNRLQTGKVTLWDYNFQLPDKKLDFNQPTGYEVGGNTEFEIYDWPGGYGRKYDGIDKSSSEQASELQKVFQDKDKTVRLRMQEIDAKYNTMIGIADCSALTAGHRFKLTNHPNSLYNTQYTLVWVNHEIDQTPNYYSNLEVPEGYKNEFKCMFNTTPYRPPRETAKSLIRGTQTAFVVGTSGEEIFTDKYGRVKIQFPWDRDGKNDANSSCWVRVAQMWAGNQWGTMFIPRIGMEVIVDFIEADPDQPIITGCVYNPQTMPPYKLPDNKTMSTIKSDSTVGGGGFNEFRFEDKKGSEQIFIHGEKDIDVRIKNDHRESIGNEQHITVGADRYEKILGNEHRQIEKDQMIKVTGNHSLKVDGESKTEATGDYSLKTSGNIKDNASNICQEAGQTIYIKAGMTLVIEAGVQLSLKGPGGFVDIGPAGVTISGTMVLINSGGAAASGDMQSPSAPDKPKDPAEAAKADPGSKMKLQAASTARKKRKFKAGAGAGSGATSTMEENKVDDHWIKVKVVDEEGKPVEGQYCSIITPEGYDVGGSSDKNGMVEAQGLKPGSCKISFPYLDADAWE